MDKKVVISIPVHEEYDVIIEHLYNIKKFVPNSSVVIHVSGDSHISLFNMLNRSAENEFKNFLYVNDKQYLTYSKNDAGNVRGLSTVHSSNFRYINNLIDFDVFALETSNDMFVRFGVETLWNNYECGVTLTTSSVEDWRATDKVANDLITDMCRFVDIKAMKKFPQEGSFYPRDVFKQVSDIVLDGLKELWSAEEMIIPTLAHNIKPEMHESCLNDSYVFHDCNDGETKESDVLAVRNGNKLNKYAVKRVPRQFNNHCRRFIRELTKND